MNVPPTLMSNLANLLTTILPGITEYFQKELPKKKRIYKKKYDRAVFTQYQFDYIINEYDKFNEFNRKNPRKRKNQPVLVSKLNRKLHLNKSISSYRRVWDGTVRREELAVGKFIHIKD